MRLSEILAAVAVRTKRPDLEDAIFLAVQQATIFCHTFDFFRRDLVEIPFRYAEPGLSAGQFIIDSVLPAFRKMSFFRKWDPEGSIAGDYLSPVEPDNMFDSYNMKKQNVYYLAGKVINWQSSSVDKAHLIGYWRSPDVSESRYDSWIAADQPFAIIERATAKIFRTIGQQEESRSALADAEQLLGMIQINEIETEGR